MIVFIACFYKDGEANIALALHEWRGVGGVGEVGDTRRILKLFT
jgi:hypothetical protein